MRLIFGFLLLLLSTFTPAQSSNCLALAQGLARVQQASMQATNMNQDEAKISFVGHATFRIETAQGIVAVTDYSGNAGGTTPDVVTMNRAHSSHYTTSPDPAIKHILRGWGEDGALAQHNFELSDLRIRNVTTDIRQGASQRIADGNSIFIFETAGLCIGHLGHLHHELTPGHMGWIGRLDVVMVPVDGRLTMPHKNMMAVLKQIKAPVIIPMHIFGPDTLAAFLAEARNSFKVSYLDSRSLTLSTKTLPTKATVMVMPGY
jgi:L-ascorbate metabolism protein UlaG (beta-lactamase superfamily)